MTAEPAGHSRPSPANFSQKASEPSAPVALQNAVARLVQVLDRETTALRQRQPVDMDDLCDRKNQALLELSRIGRRLDRDGVDAELRSQLAELRDKLDENRSILGRHLEATREVAEIVATAIRDAESDGTYSGGQLVGL